MVNARQGHRPRNRGLAAHTGSVCPGAAMRPPVSSAKAGAAPTQAHARKHPRIHKRTTRYTARVALTGFVREFHPGICHRQEPADKHLVAVDNRLRVVPGRRAGFGSVNDLALGLLLPRRSLFAARHGHPCHQQQGNRQRASSIRGAHHDANTNMPCRPACPGWLRHEARREGATGLSRPRQPCDH